MPRLIMLIFLANNNRFVVLTCKFRGRGVANKADSFARIEEKLRGVTGASFSEVDFLWLCANTPFERTLIARVAG